MKEEDRSRGLDYTSDDKNFVMRSIKGVAHNAIR